MAYTELYGLNVGKAHAITGRAVTDDHLTAGEEAVAALVRFDIRDDNLVAEWEQRPLTRAIAFKAAELYDAEAIRGEVTAEGGAGGGGVAVKRATAGDVTVELAEGARAELVDGQLVAAGTDWGQVAWRELANHGLLAGARTGRTSSISRRQSPYWNLQP